MVVASAERFDFGVGARLLCAEFVGWKSENDKSLRFVLFVDGLQVGVLRCVAALACDVDHHHDLVFVGFELDGFAVNVVHCEVEWRVGEHSGENYGGDHFGILLGFDAVGSHFWCAVWSSCQFLPTGDETQS